MGATPTRWYVTTIEGGEENRADRRLLCYSPAAMLEQRSLFDDTSPWDDDDQAAQLVATVVFATGPHQEFDYLVPEALAGQIAVGKRLRVPFGRGDRNLTGYCVRVEQRPIGSRRLKHLSGVVDARPLLSPAMLRLTTWIADRYLAGWGQVLEAVVPAGIREHAGTRDAMLLSVAPEFVEQLAQLELTDKQRHILEHLAGRGQPLTAAQLAREAKCTVAPINVLRKKGYLVAHRERVAQPVEPAPTVPREGDLRLNADQQRCHDAILAALRAGKHETLLLHGVTGSGKTEVYIRAMREVVSYGRQAIVLVPEISLTPQTVARFRARFPRVAVQHSHLSDPQRAAHWRAIAAGEVDVVVGARSAIFAPTPHLGLIILDEEHETSFKQESTPRYHARDVALERARSEGVPLVLGSATPSLESWRRAGEGAYRLLSLPRRVLNLPMPAVRTIDLRIENQRGRAKGVISRPLQIAMQRALADGGQVILLLNRRGYSTQIQCPACGLVVRCPNCDLALTHHHHGEKALCHYCDYQMPAPPACPQCEFAGIRYYGAGTQRLEAEVRARFPDHACLRMDTDAMQKPGSHERALETFRTGQAQILLGTQMIAKGLDFPNVTLVGVVDADTALHLPDFRAAERTFQLLAQVAGRSGRGERGGQVLIQTLSPDHPALLAAVQHDYEGFAGRELQLRQEHDYPPYSEMVRIIFRGPRLEPTRLFAEALAERLRTDLASLETVRVLGPAPAPLARLNDKYRFQMQMHARDGGPLRDVVRRALTDFPDADDIQWTADVDPMSML